MKKIIKIMLVIFWMGVIFTFSNQKATDSTKLSDGFIKNTIVKLFHIDDPEVIQNMTKPVRKAAHFTIYLILGILVINCFDKKDEDTIINALLICFLYAVGDEVHQVFVDGRSAEFIDVIIDTLGSILGIFIHKRVTTNK